MYFIEQDNVLLLFGGNKKTQDKDIKKAKKILKMAGIKDVYSQTYGRNRTTFNLIKACMKALEKTNRGEKK